MNKKASKILSVYWFAILILVAGGVSAMVFTFYSHPYDVREIEANIMIDKIADCLSEKGSLRSEIFDGESFLLNEENFLEKCDLNFNVEEKWEEEQYYVEINFYNVVEGEIVKNDFEINYGNKKWVSSCEIQEDEEYEKLAKCVKKRFYSLGGDTQFLIEILSVVRKTEKNVK